MACGLCAFVARLGIIIGQWALNGLNLIDHIGNWLLLGDPNETMSGRAARARQAGSKAAAVLCSVLTWFAKIISLGNTKTDHCTYALDPNVIPNAREIWDWNTGNLRAKPETIIDDIYIILKDIVKPE